MLILPTNPNCRCPDIAASSASNWWAICWVHPQHDSHVAQRNWQQRIERRRRNHAWSAESRQEQTAYRISKLLGTKSTQPWRRRLIRPLIRLTAFAGAVGLLSDKALMLWLPNLRLHGWKGLKRPPRNPPPAPSNALRIDRLLRRAAFLGEK